MTLLRLLILSVALVHAAPPPACDLVTIASNLVRGDVSSCTVGADWHLGKVLAAVQHLEVASSSATPVPACSATTLPSTACDCLGNLNLCGQRLNGGGKSVADTLKLSGGSKRIFSWIESWTFGASGSIVFTTTANHELELAGPVTIADSLSVDLNATVWKLEVTAGGNGASSSSTTAPIVFGFEVTSEMVAALMRRFGDIAFESSSCGTLSADSNCLHYLMDLFGKPVTGSLSILFASQPFGAAENPELVPPLAALRYVEQVDAGLTLFLNVGPAKADECTDPLCTFLRDAFNDPYIGLMVNLGTTKLTLEGMLGNLAIVKDKCTTAHNQALGEGSANGRPSVILDEVGIFAEYPYAALLPGFKNDGPNIGVRAALAVDMARLRAGPEPSADTCSKVITTKYDFEEPLLFEAVVTLYPSYFAVKATMKGVWRKAFGIEQLYLGNVGVGIDIQYLPTLSCPLPPMMPCGIYVAGEIAVGQDDCFITSDEEGWGLAKYDGPPLGDAPCVRGKVGAYISLKNLFNSYFLGEFDGLTLQDMVRAFGTRAQADSFNAAVPQLLRESGFRPMRWDRDGEGCEGNPCISFTPSLFPVLTSTQRKVLPGLRMFGELTVLGVTASTTVIVDPSIPYLLVEAKLHPVDVGGSGILKLIRSSSAPNEGPMLRIEIMLASGRKPIPSMIASSITSTFKTGLPTGPELAGNLRDAFAVNVSGSMSAEIVLWGASVAAVEITIGNDGFHAEFGANIGAGAGSGGSGGGFAVDVVLDAPFDGSLNNLAFDAAVTLKADFANALGVGAKDAMLSLGESVQDAAESARDVAESAMAMVADSDAADTVKASLQTVFDAVVEKGKSVLDKCNDNVLCQAALAPAIFAYTAALETAQTVLDQAFKLFDVAKEMVLAGWATSSKAFGELLSENDKVWADVVDLLSSAVDAVSSVVTIEQASFSSTLSSSEVEFAVSLDVGLFGNSASISIELDIDLNNLASAASALAAKVAEHVGAGGGNRNRKAADNAAVSDWLSSNWPSSVDRKPLSQLLLDEAGGPQGGAPADCNGKAPAECASTAMASATATISSFKSAAAGVKTTVDALVKTLDAVEVAFGAFTAAAEASVGKVLEHTEEAVEKFNDAVKDTVVLSKDKTIAAVQKASVEHVQEVTKASVAAVDAAVQSAQTVYEKSVATLSKAVDTAKVVGKALVDAAKAAVTAAVDAGKKLVDDAFALLEDVADGVGNLVKGIFNVLCSGGGSNKKGKDTNGGKPEACLCASNCKFPSCTLQTIKTGTAGWPPFEVPIYSTGLYCAGSRTQENAVDAYKAATIKAAADEAASRKALEVAEKKELDDNAAAAKAKVAGDAAAKVALAAAKDAAEAAAAKAVADAKGNAAADNQAAADEKAAALKKFAANAAAWESAASMEGRKLAFPDRLYTLAEGKYAPKPRSATPWAVLRISLAECAAKCSADPLCSYFNYADPFAMLLEAPFSEVASFGMCQLGLASFGGITSKGVKDSVLQESAGTDVTSGKAVYIYAQYHLFAKSYARRTAADGVTVQDCHPSVRWEAVGAFKHGACSSRSSCDAVEGSSTRVCRMACNTNNYRHHAEALECTAWQAPCAERGLYETQAGTPSSDRVCKSSYEGHQPNNCCDASGCSTTSFLLDESSPSDATFGAASCVATCPEGNYGDGADGMCRACAGGCASCTSATACTACTSPFVLNRDGKCSLGCGHGQQASDGDGACKDLPACQKGTSRPAGSKVCVDCPTGHVCAGGDAAPELCPAGKKPQGFENCTPNGCQVTRAYFCSSIVVGFYSDASAGGNLPCPAGNACSGIGDPLVCSDGWFQPDKQQSECLATLQTCPTGQLEAALPSSTSDRACTVDVEPPAFTGCPAPSTSPILIAAVSGPWPASEDVASFTGVDITVDDDDQVISVAPELVPAATVRKLHVGEHVFNHRAEDPAGNVAWCNFTVRVLGARPPTVECPANNEMRVVVAPGIVETTVAFNDLIVATHAYGGAVTVVASPLSGSVFAFGRTVVRAEAVDDAGNSAECYFAVVVSNADGVPSTSTAPIAASSRSTAAAAAAAAASTTPTSITTPLAESTTGKQEAGTRTSSDVQDASNSSASVDAIGGADGNDNVVDGASSSTGVEAGVVAGVLVGVLVLLAALVAFVVHRIKNADKRGLTEAGMPSQFENPAYDSTTESGLPEWADPTVPFISRGQAEKKLAAAGMVDGSFVVRQTRSVVRGFVITSCMGDTVANSQLKNKGGAFFYGNKKVGDTLEEALEALQRSTRVSSIGGVEPYLLTAQVGAPEVKVVATPDHDDEYNAARTSILLGAVDSDDELEL